MEFYKETEFRDTDIGRIPKDWQVIKIDDIAERVTKGTTPTTLGFSYVPSGINFIKIESIDENGHYLEESFGHIDEKANEALNRSVLEENDILFSIAGALGRVALVNKEILPANTNQALAIIRLKNKSRAIYSKYFLNSETIQNYIKTIAVQSAQANLTLAHVRNFIIAWPESEEQNKICQILKRIDSLIQQTDDIIRKT